MAVLLVGIELPPFDCGCCCGGDGGGDAYVDDAVVEIVGDSKQNDDVVVVVVVKNEPILLLLSPLVWSLWLSLWKRNTADDVGWASELVGDVNLLRFELHYYYYK